MRSQAKRTPRTANGSIIQGRLKPSGSTIAFSTVSERTRLGYRPQPARSPPDRRCRARPGGSGRAPARRPPRARSAPAPSSCSRAMAPRSASPRPGRSNATPRRPRCGQLRQQPAVEERGHRDAVDADHRLTRSPPRARSCGCRLRRTGGQGCGGASTTSSRGHGPILSARPALPMQCLGRWRPRDLSLGEAARAIGVSADTLRRWERAGKLRTVRDSANRRRVPAARGRAPGRPPAAPRAPATALSARNRFPGVIRSVEVGRRHGAGGDRGRARTG